MSNSSSAIKDKSDIQSILYLCNHNIIRSPMAEALTRHYFGTSVYAASAGVETGTADPFVDAALAELGIDLNNREPQALEYLDDTYFDVIVTLSPTAHHVALSTDTVTAGEVLYWASADPTVVQGSREQMLGAYRDVRDRLDENIKALFAM
jgi:protein-tyrosine-phosphatase